LAIGNLVMAFVSFSLIFGGLLLAIPIVLHLVMRQQPKQLVFPALRFIKQRRDANRRKLQMRHWLLLLLRCLAIAILAAALARPSVHSMVLGDWIIVGILAGMLAVAGLVALLSVLQRRGRVAVGGSVFATLVLAVALAAMLRSTLRQSEKASIGNEQAPVAAVLVFDSSPRMQYLWQNKTRLERAQEIAFWLIRQLPAESEVAVVDSRPGGAVFAVDLAAAQRSIERMETTGVPMPLVGVLEKAVQLAKASNKGRKEVYVFTDVTRAAWTAESPTMLQRRLAEAEDVLVYAVDVGVDAPQNTTLGDVRLSADVLPKSGELTVQTELSCVGAGGKSTVELHIEEPNPERPLIVDGEMLVPDSQLRGQQIVELPDDASQIVNFHLTGLHLGSHQGQIKIAGQDGLVLDNVRYFTIEIQEASPVLVLAPAGVNTKFFVETIAPYEFRETGKANYDCTVRKQADLPNLDLEDYAAVGLLDPLPLMPPDWDKLVSYVRGGGGLAVFLGHNADTTSFNDPSAYPLIGGKLARKWRSAGDVFVTLRDLSHPVTLEFRDIATSVPWPQFPVYRHWVLEDFSENARLVIPFSNNKPALVETTLAQGRTLTMTTPVSDPLRPSGRQTWNELSTGEDAWPCFMLVNEMMRHLVDTSSTKLNYLAGETALLPNSRGRHPDRYQLFTPLGQPQDVAAADGSVTVKFTEYPGAYRLKGIRGGPVVRGFSVNLPKAASELARLPRSDLDGILGPNRYHYARSEDEIVLGVGEARLGREFYPFLIALVAIVLAMEHLLASRFYRRSEP